MSWNVEVLCIHDAAQAMDLSASVPDVFGPTKEGLCFEDATSGARGSGLAAGRIGVWVVVIDTCCRFSSEGKASEHLDAISSERDVHLFRMSDAPLYRHHRDGAEIQRADGGACRAMVRSTQRDDMDGEGIAIWLIEQFTGLTWDDLFNAEYTAFDMD